MRVIAGEFRSRRLLGPPPGVRPTSDRVREAIFSSLGPVDGKRVLDLYAGTGALGIEALSRGAASAVFVEISRRSTSVIRANLEGLGLADRSDLVRDDVEAFVKRAVDEQTSFDLVFLDPPYDSGTLLRVLQRLSEGPLLDPRAQVVVETSSRDTVGEIAGLDVRSERDYGDTKITRFCVFPAETNGGPRARTGEL